MPPITWKNVSGPNSAAALAALERAGQNLGGAISGLGETVQGYSEDRTKSETDAFIAELNNQPDDAARQAMVADASKAFLDMGQVSTAQTAAQEQDFRVAGEARAVEDQAIQAAAEQRSIEKFRNEKGRWPTEVETAAAVRQEQADRAGDQGRAADDAHLAAVAAQNLIKSQGAAFNAFMGVPTPSPADPAVQVPQAGQPAPLDAAVAAATPPAPVNVPTTVADATAGFQPSPEPVVVNPGIFDAKLPDFKALGPNANIQLENLRAEGVKDYANWALMGKTGLSPDTLQGMTPDAIRKEFQLAQASMPENLPQKEGADALIAALKRAGANTTAIGSGKITVAQKLENARIKHVNILRDEIVLHRNTHTLPSVTAKFKDIPPNEIIEIAEHLRTFVVFPEIKKGMPMQNADKEWILYEAMKNIGTTDDDFVGKDFETISNTSWMGLSDQDQSDITNSITNEVNRLVKNYSKPTGRAVIAGENKKLLGSILDLPQY